MLDPATGQRDHCGVIAKKRKIGNVTVWLTYDEPNRFWWIVWKDDRLRKVGFHEARRQTCWELFTELDENSLAQVRDQTTTDQERNERN